MSAILDAAVDAMIVSDARGAILRVNKAAVKMFGYDASEMVGQNVSMLMPEALAKQHDAFISHYLQTNEKRIIGVGRDMEGVRKDQQIFPLHLTINEADVAGTHMFIGILHDLTRRKATQEALARSQRLDAIGQMTGGIAHDFNNILTVVIGNLELLGMRCADEKQQSLIQDALEAAELGVDLTSRLMVFARKSELYPIESDLRELCEDTLSILKRTIGESCKLKTDFAPDLKKVYVDPTQMQSALINLALNARDAMKAKGELLISLANVTVDDSYIAQEIDVVSGEYVRLSVSDDGDGMSPETQKRAFEPFYTTKSDSGGTGLGLAMVYGFVRQSGGHITLYSEPGLGTSFNLYFPAAESSVGESRARPSQAADDQLVRANGKTVLVVEDNPKVLKLTVERIRDLGFRVEEANSGDAAYALLKSGLDVDIVFSDLVMPGSLTGYDLAEKLSADYPSIKVLLTSGYASDVVTAKMAHSKVYDILHKPYRQIELSRRLQALLAGESDA